MNRKNPPKSLKITMHIEHVTMVSYFVRSKKIIERTSFIFLSKTHIYSFSSLKEKPLYS